MKKVYVARWDCKTCGHKGIRGPETECPSCGGDRPKDVKFYLPDESSYVETADELRRARAGADWRCSYCGQNNPADVGICTSCGNPRSESEKRLDVREYSSGAVPNSGKKLVELDATIRPPVPPKKKRWRIVGGIFVLLVIGLIILAQSKTVMVTVEGFQWERKIATQVERLVEEEDWRLPPKGNLKQSFRAVHHYDKILDHYETRTRTQKRATGTEQYVCGKRDLGNGYFEDKMCTRTTYETYEEEYEEPVYRQEPVYKTKYRYTIYRWKKGPPIVTSGGGKNAQWGDITFLETDPRRRAGKRKESYIIRVRDEKSETHEHKIPYKEWDRLNKGDQLKASRGAVTGVYRGLDEPWAKK